MKKKFLVIIDESKELGNAIYFAANRALHTDGKLSLLYVVDPAINAQWAKIENLIEQEATSEAKKFVETGHKKLKKGSKLTQKLLLKSVIDQRK